MLEASHYRAVLLNGRAVAASSFAGRAIPNDLVRARLGLVAAKKAAPRSVDRNRGKRLVRAVFDENHALLPSLDIVVLMKNDLRKKNNLALRRELRALLEKLSMIALPPVK